MKSSPRGNDAVPAHAPANPRVTVEDAKAGLIETARLFYDRGWSVGTSSNYSVLLSREPFRILVTASGKDKRKLTMDDFVIVDEQGYAVDPPGARPSAETHLHIGAYQEHEELGSVLHTHSIWGTLLSDQFFPQGGLALEGYEMLKGLSGVTTHEYREWVPIFENTQDIPSLAHEVRQRTRNSDRPPQHGYLIRRHGLYTWGRDLAEARRQIEIFEFLFEVLVRRQALAPT